MPFLAAIPAVIGLASSAAGAAGIISTTTAALVATGAAAVSGAVGAVQSSEAKSQADKYNAGIAQNNVTIANQNAQVVAQQTDQKQQADYRAGAIKMGAQRAALGAAGGTLDSGSAADVQKNTAESTALGVSNDAYQGQLQQYSLRTTASNYQGQANLDRSSASNDQTAGMIGAGNSLLSGASSFSSKWNQYYNSGNTGSGGAAAA